MINYIQTPFDTRRIMIVRQDPHDAPSAQFRQAQVIIPERGVEYWDNEEGDLGIGLCGHMCKDPKAAGCCKCVKFWGACKICIEAMDTHRD